MAQLGNTPLGADANLKGYWKLEADGTDSSGLGKTLSPTGSPSYVAGRLGNALSLPTSASKLSIAQDLGVGGGACSIAYWLKQSSEIGSGDGAYIQQNDAGTVTGYSIQYEYNAGTRRLYFRRSKWNVAHQGPYYNVALGTVWNHLVLTYDGTNVRGYLNGALVAGPTAASGNGTGSVSDVFTIVGDPNNAVQFDDVSFFNDALTAAEVLMLYRTNFKSRNGLVNSGVKSINGLAAASIKSINGLL